MPGKRNILIVGGGTAGWLTAAYLAKSLGLSETGPIEITLLESPEIGIIGVGEGTFPTIRTTLQFLGIDESRGTKPLDRGCRGKDSAGASALGYEATGDILVRHRHLGFSEQPFLQLARTTSGEGAEAVEPP